MMGASGKMLNSSQAVKDYRRFRIADRERKVSDQVPGHRPGSPSATSQCARILLREEISIRAPRLHAIEEATRSRCW